MDLSFRAVSIIRRDEVYLVILALSIYFLLACLASWLILFPEGRDVYMQALAKVGLSARQQFPLIVQRRRADAVRITRSWMERSRTVLRHVRKNRLAYALATTLVCSPPLIAVLSSTTLDLDLPARKINLIVVAVLDGEQLVPPAALPPLAFATDEVQQARPMLVSASRDWALLDRSYAQSLLKVFRIMKEKHGYDMVILEGYRSPERQNLLAGMGSSVTNARAFQSWHQYGFAADCAFLRNKKIVISEKDPWAMRGYQLFGKESESLGLTWGGRWKLMDFGHTELRQLGVRKR